MYSQLVEATLGYHRNAEAIYRLQAKKFLAMADKEKEGIDKAELELKRTEALSRQVTTERTDTMATLEEHVKHPGRASGIKDGNPDLKHGRKGHTEKQAPKMDYSERGGREHGKTHKDCY